jgi:hypothetical protein
VCVCVCVYVILSYGIEDILFIKKKYGKVHTYSYIKRLFSKLDPIWMDIIILNMLLVLERVPLGVTNPI